MINMKKLLGTNKFFSVYIQKVSAYSRVSKKTFGNLITFGCFFLLHGLI